MAVPNIFGSATSAIPLSQLDQNFATAITLGNTAVYLGNTTTSLGNVTLTNVTISSGNVSVSTATVGAGTAAAPAITTTGDTNTGIFFPAADTIAFSEGGVESMRIDASGNMGLGVTPSAWFTGYKAFQLTGDIGFASTGGALRFNNYLNTGASADIYYGNGWAGRYRFTLGNHIWDTAASGTAGGTVSFTSPMTLDASGNLGIGTSSPGGYRINVQQAAADNLGINVTASNGTSIIRMLHNGTVGAIDVSYTGGGSYSPLVFRTSDTERMRIDSSGNLLVGTTSASLSTNTFFKAGGASQPVLYLFKNSAANTDQAFCIANGVAGGTVSFQVLASGNAQNTNNSYGAISDAKLKENIVDATPKLEKLNQVRIVNFNMIGDEQKQIGVIAQELEQIFPGMVDESPDYEEVKTTDEDGNETTERVATGTTTKSVKYSVFVPMLIKAIQEQQAIITSLTDRITALEAK